MKVKGRQNSTTSQNVFSRLSPGPVVTGEGSEPPGQPEWTQPPAGSGRGSKGQGARLSWQPGPGQRQLDSRRSTRTQLQEARGQQAFPRGLAGNCVQSSSAWPESLFFVIRYLQTN
ncbi:unnamed protein product [Rangifer tarandus platyrhynchus]|uniref:Uncharacterized protein n=1 Tax=Rangifer tarandus platyrhynchus TaxID=3082113 RepID=A0AC59YAH1_RANTA